MIANGRNKNRIPPFSIPMNIPLVWASEFILEVFIFLLVIRSTMRKEGEGRAVIGKTGPLRVPNALFGACNIFRWTLSGPYISVQKQWSKGLHYQRLRRAPIWRAHLLVPISPQSARSGKNLYWANTLVSIEFLTISRLKTHHTQIYVALCRTSWEDPAPRQAREFPVTANIRRTFPLCKESTHSTMANSVNHQQVVVMNEYFIAIRRLLHIWRWDQTQYKNKILGM